MDSWNQRSRWSKGIIECFRIYKKPLLKKIIKERDFAALDKFMFAIAPYFQVLGVGLTLMLGVFNILGIELNDLFSYFFSLGYVCFMIGYLCCIIMNMFVILYYKRDIETTMHGILLFMVFLMSWIPINIICLFKKDLKWVEIEHNRKANMDTLLNENQ